MTISWNSLMERVEEYLFNQRNQRNLLNQQDQLNQSNRINLTFLENHQPQIGTSLPLYKKVRTTVQKAEPLLTQEHQVWHVDQPNQWKINLQPKKLLEHHLRNFINHTAQSLKMAKLGEIKRHWLILISLLNEHYCMMQEQVLRRHQVRIESRTDKEVTSREQAERVREAYLKSTFIELVRKIRGI